MDSDEEDFVFVGTPLEREEELNSRKKKALAESSGHLRTLVPWKQEVRDEEGRRRFHGAFTGGYSAGYYNTVGSKQGWTPQSFTSSRKNRAEIKQQSITSFLDDDEKAEMEGKNLGTSFQFDTFGFTAAEHARKQAEKEQSQRPAIIPGPVPDELVAPASDSIGVKLLLKMGWRHGRSIRDAHANSQYDARREARKALLALSFNGTIVDEGSKLVETEVDDLNEQSGGVHVFRSTPAFLLQQKQDMHGLGYDPYKEAPEFRDKKKTGLAMSRDVGKRKHSSIRDEIFSSRSGRVAPGFGIGALEELDAEDEDIYGSGYNFEETYVQEVEEPPQSAADNKWQLIVKEPDRFPRFRPATKSDHGLERFNPPEIPKDFVPHHKFPAPLLPKNRITESPPMEVPSPEDNNLKVMIEGVASLVARCGKLFEDLSREKNQSNPLFSFLSGGLGSEYYARKLCEEQQKRRGQVNLLPDEKPSSDKQKLSADSRGRILGEKPLERSLKEANASVSPVNNVQIQSQLSDNFTAPELSKELLEIAKPFKHDPAKQERFEQFIKDKYQGGLRSTYSSGANDMSEAARARERLDFEAAAEAIEKSKRTDKNKLSTQQLMELTMNAGLQFTSGGAEAKASVAEDSTRKMYPKREEFTWRPTPLLCKRFDIIDPYMGKPPPAPRSKSKLDALIFSSGTTQNTKVQEEVNPTTYLDLPHFNAQEMSTSEARNTENEVAVEVENVERPVDLYKAIFSDDDEEEEVPSLSSQAEDPQRKIQAASMTFSRLIAGDFLESLGKELGMHVPDDTNLATNKIKLSSSDSRVETPLVPGDTNSILAENKLQSASVNKSHRYEILQSQESKAFLSNEDGRSPRSKTTADNVCREREDGVKLDKTTIVDRKSRDSSRHHDYENNSSSFSVENERSKKRYKRRMNERSDTESDDASGDYRDNRPNSGSRSWKKRHTRDKSLHKRKHSSSSSHKGSHKGSREDYPGSHRSQRNREKGHSERKREKHKRER